MVDVRGDVLRPPHGTTPAAVKSNKLISDPVITRQRKPEETYCNFANFKSKTDINQNVVQINKNLSRIWV